MGRTACTEPECLYKGALYLYLTACTLSIFTTDEVYGCKKVKFAGICYILWWCQQNREFPHITKAVHFIYANPTSSSASERRFCTAGGVIQHRSISETLHIYPFKPRIKSHLLFAGIIRSSPFSPR